MNDQVRKTYESTGKNLDNKLSILDSLRGDSSRHRPYIRFEQLIDEIKNDLFYMMMAERYGRADVGTPEFFEGK